MSLVLQLRNERAEINTKIQALAKIEADGGSLTAEQLGQFTELEAQFNAVTDKLARAEAAERLAAASAVPLTESAQGITGPPGGHVSGPFTPPKVKGAEVAQMVRLLAGAQGNPMAAAQMAQQGGFDPGIAMALGTVTPGAGGVLVPTNYSRDLIEALRPASVIRSMGVRSLPLNNGNLTMPRITGNTVVTYIGTEEDIQLTGMTFGNTKLSAKKAAALVPVANDLIRMSGVSPDVDSLVVNDLVTSCGLSQDLHFIRSNGGGGLLPKGLRYWALAHNVITAPKGASLTTLQAVEMFLGKLMLRVESANVNMKQCGWLMNPRELRWLESLRDGNGNKAYPEIAAGKLKGYPYAVTTQIPVNLGAAGNETEIYFANFADLMIGEEMSLVIDISKEASYTDANGKVVSTFQRDESLIRVIAEHDFGPRHVESVVVAIGVDWGKDM
ncbi:phage major capsid protein [Pseudomonas sp. NPDC086581]|uniref:phage major capsid protein n=1 Tax=Pseudomonas sp. NPDC086581 TaxID=3364432 RepID=UPI00380DD708